MSSQQVRASPATHVVLKMKPTPGVILGTAGLGTQCRGRASQEEQHPGDVWFSISASFGSALWETPSGAAEDSGL